MRPKLDRCQSLASGGRTVVNILAHGVYAHVCLNQRVLADLTDLDHEMVPTADLADAGTVGE